MKAIKLNKNQNLTKKGFTIIEVVLVLAIAGLIFLMVFLALPALQRSQRDAQRKQDIAMVVTALHNWKANNKGRGYASMGNSVLTPLTDLNEEQKKYGVNNGVEPIENSPLNSYISFDLKSGKNKNNISSSLSLNTKIVTTSVNNNVTLFRIDSPSFRDHERIAVVVGMGCDNIELASNRSVVLRNIKKGAAAVVYLLESGGAYCQEA
jgi:hypothetical protein cdiviTM7_02704